LANFETPKLGAVMVQPAPDSPVTRFPLKIFDAQRREVNLEFTASPAPAPAPSAEAKPVDGVLAPEAAKPAEAPKPPETKPDEPTPDDAASNGNDGDDGSAWVRMQYFRQMTGYGMSNRERLWTRRS
jgi:hypothetical protein